MRPLRLVAFLLVFVGCQLSSPLPDGPTTTTRIGEEQPSDGASSPETLAPQPPRLTVPDCPPNAFCALGFEIEGRFWSLGCLGIKPESVAPTVVALGDTLVDEVRKIDGVAPEIMAAAHPIDPRACGDEPPEVGIEWFAAFGPADTTRSEAAAMSLARAICGHSINPLPGDRCEEGGSIRWFPGEGNQVRYGYFPEYQAQVEGELALGIGPLWRRDPEQVVARYWSEEHNVCTSDSSFYIRCRMGVRTIEVDGARADVELILQWGTADASQTLYETYHQHLTLTSTGEAWWVVAFEEDPAIVDGAADAGRIESDRRWQGCCLLPVVDVEQGIKPSGLTETGS